MIGALGTIPFEVSEKVIRTFSDFSRTTAGRWTSHEILGRKPKTQFLGPGLDRITFSIRLDVRFGVRPEEEINKLMELARVGKAVPFVIGGKGYGTGLWTIQSVEQTWGHVDNKGKVLIATANLTLEEYVK